MSAGPLRRAIGLLGLLALAPVLLQLALGTITPEDAALRALAIAVVVVGLGRLAQLVLTRLLHRVERRRSDDEVERQAGHGPASGGTATSSS
jgi:hypothetical protein